MARPICDIASEIKHDWKNISIHAKPYLSAMFELNNINDKYLFDDARSIIAYFLVNAVSWRGDVARRVKKELRAML